MREVWLQIAMSFGLQSATKRITKCDRDDKVRGDC